jgi:hypothetical protein
MTAARGRRSAALAPCRDAATWPCDRSVRAVARLSSCERQLCRAASASSAARFFRHVDHVSSGRARRRGRTSSLDGVVRRSNGISRTHGLDWTSPRTAIHLADHAHVEKTAAVRIDSIEFQPVGSSAVPVARTATQGVTPARPGARHRPRKVGPCAHWCTFVLRTPVFALGAARRAHAPCLR